VKENEVIAGSPEINATVGGLHVAPSATSNFRSITRLRLNAITDRVCALTNLACPPEKLPPLLAACGFAADNKLPYRIFSKQKYRLKLYILVFLHKDINVSNAFSISLMVAV